MLPRDDRTSCRLQRPATSRRLGAFQSIDPAWVIIAHGMAVRARPCTTTPCTPDFSFDHKPLHFRREGDGERTTDEARGQLGIVMASSATAVTRIPNSATMA